MIFSLSKSPLLSQVQESFLSLFCDIKKVVECQDCIIKKILITCLLHIVSIL